MPIVWNGLSMTTKGCSVHMSLLILRSRVLDRTLSHMIEIILTHSSVKHGIVDPDEYRFFYSPGKAMVLSPYDAELSGV